MTAERQTLRVPERTALAALEESLVGSTEKTPA